MKRNLRKLRSQRQRNPKPRNPRRLKPKRAQKRRQQRKLQPKRLGLPRKPSLPKNLQLRNPQSRSLQPKRRQRSQQRKPLSKRSRCLVVIPHFSLLPPLKVLKAIFDNDGILLPARIMYNITVPNEKNYHIDIYD